MSTVNMKAWYEANADKLTELKEQYLQSVTEDEDLLGGTVNENGISTITIGHELPFKPWANIFLDPVDELSSAFRKASFELPEKPGILDGDYKLDKYRVHVFSDIRLDSFEDRLNGIYSNFTPGTDYSISTVTGTLAEQVVEATMEKGYDRDIEDLTTAMDAEANDWAAEGYTRAPGALAYELSELADRFDRDHFNRTEAVFGSMAQICQKNIQDAFENGISIEDLHMDFAIAYSELSKVFIGSQVDAYVAEIDKRVKEHKAQLALLGEYYRAIGLDTEADIKKHELELSLRTEGLNAFIDATNSFIDSKANLIMEQIKLAQNVAEGFGGIFASYGSLFTGVSYEEA